MITIPVRIPGQREGVRHRMQKVPDQKVDGRSRQGARLSFCPHCPKDMVCVCPAQGERGFRRKPRKIHKHSTSQEP